MLPWTNENAVAGHMRPAGLYLDGPHWHNAFTVLGVRIAFSFTQSLIVIPAFLCRESCRQQTQGVSKCLTVMGIRRGETTIFLPESWDYEPQFSRKPEFSTLIPNFE